MSARSQRVSIASTIIFHLIVRLSRAAWFIKPLSLNGTDGSCCERRSWKLSLRNRWKIINDNSLELIIYQRSLLAALLFLLRKQDSMRHWNLHHKRVIECKVIIVPVSDFNLFSSHLLVPGKEIHWSVAPLRARCFQGCFIVNLDSAHEKVIRSFA